MHANIGNIIVNANILLLIVEFLVCMQFLFAQFKSCRFSNDTYVYNVIALDRSFLNNCNTIWYGSESQKNGSQDGIYLHHPVAVVLACRCRRLWRSDTPKN